MRNNTFPIIGLVAGLGLMVALRHEATATSGDPASLHAALRDARALGSVTGVVLDSNGDPIPGAKVAILAQDGSLVAEAKAASDSDGEMGLGQFRIDQIPGGIYSLTATVAQSDSEGRLARFPVTAYEDTRVRVHVDLGY